MGRRRAGMDGVGGRMDVCVMGVGGESRDV